MTNTAAKTTSTPTVEQPTGQEPRQLPQWSLPRILDTWAAAAAHGRHVLGGRPRARRRRSLRRTKRLVCKPSPST